MHNKYQFEVLLENEEKFNKQKKSRSMERTNFLYEKGKIKIKINQLLKEKSEKIKIQNEIKECTWKPKLNKLKPKMEQKLKTLINDTKIYNRNYKFKNQSKFVEKNTREKDIYEHTFNPTVKFLIFISR
jgi:hypothetical protein